MSEYKTEQTTNRNIRHQTLGWYLFLINCDPVRVCKPLVLLDVSDAVLQVAETLCQIHLQLVAQEVFDFGTEVRWKPHLK